MLEAHNKTFITQIFLSQNLNQPQQIRGAWNDNYAHKILAPNSIRIVRYQAFTLEKFGPLIAFLAPQIAAVKALRSKPIRSNFSKIQENYIKCPPLFSLLSCLSSLYSLLAKKWKARKKWRTRMTEMVRVEEKEERRGRRKRSAWEGEDEREESEFSSRRK